VHHRREASKGADEGDTPHLGVLEASPNAIIAVDQTGRIIYANPQVEATFGYAHDELIGQPVELLIPERIGDRHVGYRDGFLAHPNARPMGIGMDLAGRRKDGTEFPVEISLSPVGSAEGREVFATVVDITARKTAERSLAESEQRFRAVLEASPNAIIAVDPGGHIIYANPQVEATFGYDRAELTGLPVEVLIPERVRERHADHRSGFLVHPNARPMGIGMDLAGRRKDGSEFPVEISLSPVVTDEAVEVFATVVDITARKAAEMQLLQAQKLESIGRLAGGIAHDFNNMLFAIRGFGEMLIEDLAPERQSAFDHEAARMSVEAITTAADRAAALTHQLLAFSRRQDVTPRTIDLNVSVQSIEPMLRRLIEEHIHLDLSLEPGLGMIRADPGQVDQILLNLVVNARDAMPEGGTVTIATHSTEFEARDTNEHFAAAPGRYVQLAVSDTGVGMDRETKEHIFEPFFTTKEVGKGTGLGLATIYGIVQQLGGHLWLYSEPGQGSTFKLYFPLHEAPVEAMGPEQEPEAQDRAGTIMVVEDEDSVREMTSMLLERAGYTVIAVQDGVAALTAIAEGIVRIDVLVTDVVMPRMSGVKLAERMIERYPSIGLVLLSGYLAETLDLSFVISRGARFVSKPVASREFLAAVDDAMASTRRIRSAVQAPNAASRTGRGGRDR
jgi:PAS domain S-box-containing protein